MLIRKLEKKHESDHLETILPFTKQIIRYIRNEQMKKMIEYGKQKVFWKMG